MAAPNGAQTPIWVPVLVGAIGLAGVVATQIIASVRAAKERKAAERREDLRWTRERDAREQLFDREDRYRSHSERSEAYAKLILALDRWQDRLGTVRAGWSVSGESASEDEERLLEEAELQTEGAASLVKLLAPPSVRGVYRTAWARFVYCQITATTNTSNKDEVDSAYNQASKTYRRLLDEMRTDLGVEPEPKREVEQELAPASEVNPTPPLLKKQAPRYRGPH